MKTWSLQNQVTVCIRKQFCILCRILLQGIVKKRGSKRGSWISLPAGHHLKKLQFSATDQNPSDSGWDCKRKCNLENKWILHRKQTVKMSLEEADFIESLSRAKPCLYRDALFVVPYLNYYIVISKNNEKVYWTFLFVFLKKKNNLSYFHCWNDFFNCFWN